MDIPVIIFLCVFGAVLLITAYLLFGGYIAYKMTFYHDPKRDKPDPYRFVKNDGSERDELSRALISELLAVPFEDVYVRSHDGLLLHGYMHCEEKNEKVAILLHGYKSTPFTDFSGGALLLMKLGYNIIMVDQRAHGLSEGNTLSFGALEHKDAVSWARFAEDTFGEGVPIALVGVSMGAGTVVMAAREDMPRGVFAVVADCPFSSAYDIIKRVASTRMGIPAPIAMPIVRVGASLFGGFSLADAEPRVSARELKIPLLLIHGEGDNFVPPEMSREIFEAGGALAALETFPDATHGTSFLYDREDRKSVV